MKAVFIQRDCLLRSSGYDASNLPEDWKPSSEVLDAMQILQQEGFLNILIGKGWDTGKGESSGKDGDLTQRIATAIDATNSLVDAIMVCSHNSEAECNCWVNQPGYLYEAAKQLDLKLDECYLLADSATDVEMAHMAGCRATLVLGGRTLAEIFGDQPKYKDFATALDFPTAVRYICDEEAIAQQIGPRQVSTPPMDLELMDSVESMPTLIALSPRAQALQSRQPRPRLQPQEIGRWLLFFVAGGVGLSLGIAYILTHLYRQKRFPEWVWYATLQFIPRQIRGVLFILIGVTVLSMAIWSFYRTFTNGTRWRRGS